MLAFADRLTQAIVERSTALVVGLDPRPELLPEGFFPDGTAHHSVPHPKHVASAIVKFNQEVIDSVGDLVVAVKPQAAFYERFGLEGLGALIATIRYARARGLLVILDAKRGDIASTAEAYALAYLGGPAAAGEPVGFDVDALTVNPYLGSDGIMPFVRVALQHGRGLFVLVRTSNPSSVEFQRLSVGDQEQTLAGVVAAKVAEWGAKAVGKTGYSSVGAVVGATFPEEARDFRKLMPHSYFLVPGVGAQGGDASALSNFFNDDGLGAVIASSRSIIYAFRDPEFTGKHLEEAWRGAASRLRNVVEQARSQAAKH